MSRGAGSVRLVQIVDRAMAMAVERSGSWIVCRRGCTECCTGAFPISSLDAARLRDALEAADAECAARVRERARAYLERYGAAFPGDRATGILDETQDELFADFADDAPCPALDPETGTCDLYEARPLTCRTFGPAIRAGGGAVAACEQCYAGATDEQIAACAADLDTGALEEPLLPSPGLTIVAFALR